MNRYKVLKQNFLIFQGGPINQNKIFKLLEFLDYKLTIIT